jgi:hypothetical protein
MLEANISQVAEGTQNIVDAMMKEMTSSEVAK